MDVASAAERYRAAEARYRRVRICDRVKDAQGWGTTVRLRYARETDYRGDLVDVRLVCLLVNFDGRGTRPVTPNRLDQSVDINGDWPLMPFGEACYRVAEHVALTDGERPIHSLLGQALVGTSLAVLAQQNEPDSPLWRAYVRVLQSTRHERRASGLFTRP